MNDFNLAWATPFLKTQTQSETLSAQLRQLILDCETEEFRKTNSPQRHHEGLFESRFDFLDWPMPQIQEFKQLFLGYLFRFVKLVNDLSDQSLHQLNVEHECWFHITRNGGYFQPHNHPNASWSAIYSVDPGDDTPVNDSAAGHIMFLDPRHCNAYLDPANRYMRRDMSFNAVRFRMKVAELLIFPSYLYHYVEPYIGDRPRITIAANFRFKYSNR